MKFAELVKLNRSCRGFDRSVPVTREELIRLVDLARLVPSACNFQPLCYHVTADPEEAAAIQKVVHFGGGLKEWSLPLPGQEAPAFIMIAQDTTRPPKPGTVGMDVGIAAQTILLAAAEQGLSGLMIGNFKPADIAEILHLPETILPVLMLAIGKSAEKAVLEEMPESGRTLYWRDPDGTHHVPKRSLEDVLI